MMDSDRFRYIAGINRAFTPSLPITSRDSFAGRSRELQKVVGVVCEPGKHAVIYGERGVGKTSLANTIFDFLVYMGRHNYQRARINCSRDMTFGRIWQGVFRQLTTKLDGEDVSLDQSIPDNPNSEDIRHVFSLMDDPSIVIIDEFDRLERGDIETTFADTIKTLSDNDADATLVIVGVADSLNQLIAEHKSIQRAIREIPVTRMSKLELLEIVQKGLKQCDGLSIDPDPLDRIADYSQGLPSITHLLAREACFSAVQGLRTQVTMADLNTGMKEAVDAQLETCLEAYRCAVTAPRGIHFKPVLLACAMAKKDDHGFFYANQVTEPLRLISNKADFDIPQFAFHLKAFCSEQRGHALEKRGKQYRFVYPIMEPYVILRGLADGMISESQLSRPSVTSTEPEQLSLLFPSAALVLEP
jgi:nucleoside-triphosphatase THEP1